MLAREEAMCPPPVLLTATAFLLLTKLHETRLAVGSRRRGAGGSREEEGAIRNGSSSGLTTGLGASAERLQDFLPFPRQNFVSWKTKAGFSFTLFLQNTIAQMVH